MIQCFNCGQANSAQSNFCRFCGAHFTLPENQTDYDIAPPRPYVWKTDEFQISKAKQRKTEEFRLNELNRNTAPVQNQPFQTQQLAQTQPQWISKNYQCPRCGSNLTPRFEKKISNTGWIVFAVLLITFFPLFWIGFLIKEDVRVCQVCNLTVG
ncbi:MAG: LITAF-like zinc ribbon domain-containing protein [Pyrinomonadaceae bacterium]